MTTIEKFAIDKLGITLTKHQVGLIRDWSKGNFVHENRQAGRTTAKKVMYAYVEDACNTPNIDRKDV